jgi:hypothetical protein
LPDLTALLNLNGKCDRLSNRQCDLSQKWTSHKNGDSSHSFYEEGGIATRRLVRASAKTAMNHEQLTMNHESDLLLTVRDFRE